MSVELEKKILGNIIDSPDLRRRYNIRSAWFEDSWMSKVIEALTMSRREYKDLSEMIADIHSLYPNLPIEEKDLRALRLYKERVQDFKASLKTLEKQYLTKKAVEASSDYARQPTEENRRRLHDWLRIKDEVEAEDDEGKIKQPIEAFIHDLDHESQGGIKTFPKVDRVLGSGLEGGTLLTIGARPAVGKTAYAVNLAIEALRRNADMTIDFFTLEMTKKQMLKRFISNLTRINSYKFRNASQALNDEEKKRVIQSANWIGRTGLRIHDKRMNIYGIERMIRQRVFDQPNQPYMAIIDYLGLVDAGNDRMARTEQVGMITRTLKLLTNDLDIPILLLSQLNRAIEARDNKTPTLSDLRESGNIEQDSNVVAFLHESKEETSSDQVKRIDLTVAKNRDGMTAKIGYYFNGGESRFEEI